MTQSGIEYGQVEVFCPGKLLEQVITHLLENLEKHRVPGAAVRLHVVYEQPDQDTMRIVVRNSGTVARTPHGHGLEALNDKLRTFGGSLRGREPGEEDGLSPQRSSWPCGMEDKRGPDTRTDGR